MKFSAVLLALVAAVAAPLTAAQPASTCTPTSAEGLLLGNLTIKGEIKRTSVRGGSRIVQTYTVKNNNAAATSVRVLTAYDPANTLLKGSAKVPGSSRAELVSVTLAAAPGLTFASTALDSGLPKAISIPSGKTLKATVAWRAKRCPTADYVFGPAIVAIDLTCWKSYSATNSPTTVKVTAAKQC